jgi:N6-adenosine-specific RNA methylase IME4
MEEQEYVSLHIKMKHDESSIWNLIITKNLNLAIKSLKNWLCSASAVNPWKDKPNVVTRGGYRARTNPYRDLHRMCSPPHPTNQASTSFQSMQRENMRKRKVAYDLKKADKISNNRSCYKFYGRKTFKKSSVFRRKTKKDFLGPKTKNFGLPPPKFLYPYLIVTTLLIPCS